ncbi:MAG: TAT-variant-translocated molybdopterin oxidoreductase [Planctomycetota bacterium]
MTDTATKPTAPASDNTYWRSLEQLEGTEEFQEFVHREFPQAASEIPEGVSRRRWMQLMGASFTLAAAQGCRWETEKIHAFANRPEGYVPGTQTKFATTAEIAGSPRHLLVSCYDGRPIKVDGNAEHPSSAGGSDGYTQAMTLSLYDPDRQSKLIERGERSLFTRTWSEFEEFAAEVLEKLAPKSGAGLAVLMQPSSSLALADSLKRLIEKLPQTSVFQYAPLDRANELAGAEMAFGEPIRCHFDLSKADVIACFEADLLSSMPQSVKATREYAKRREPDTKKNPAGRNRIYAVESQFSVTGASADHRLALRACDIPAMLAEVRSAVEKRLAGETPSKPAAVELPAPPEDGFYAKSPEAEGGLPEYSAAFAYALAEDLVQAKGKGLLVVGETLPAEAHAIAHEINTKLENAGAAVTYTKEPALLGETQVGDLAELIGDIAEKKVDTLLILGGNPVYDAPADSEFAEYLAKAPHTIHLSEYDNETSRACEWSLPQAHALESWDVFHAWDGAISTAQPLIDPLLDGRSAPEVLTMLAEGPGEMDGQAIVRQAVAAASEAAAEDEAWKKLLHDGFAEDTTWDTTTPALAGPAAEPPAAPKADTLELVFTASSHTYDGRFANNGWLQETPDPVTKLTWDNAALVSFETAKELGVKQGELLKLTVGEEELLAPVFLQPGQAPGSIGLALGYGRTAAGRVGGMVNEDGSKARSEFVVGERGNWGRYPLVQAIPGVSSLLVVPANPVGVDSYRLRTSASDRTERPFGADIVLGVTAEPTGKSYELASTQNHHAIDELGLAETYRRSGDLIREGTLGTYEENPTFAKDLGAHVPEAELWDELSYNSQSGEGQAWGMVIDLNKCIGCNACSVACQAENNVPVVGKDQVLRGREMHWIRIDRYFVGSHDAPRMVHQPLSCQHCETAPCEQVCPVAATVHSVEGLNDMVYNRCIGTRYCANNCPFKVRRFNFFHYTDKFDQANNELMRLVMNPEVTVRSRGVMEKCTFCTQRISAARIQAKNEGRPIRDGDVVTACQDACNTDAISFGDLNDRSSKVAEMRENERAYTLLDGLRVKPRTTYLARVINPHPMLEPYLVLKKPEPHAGHHGHGDHGESHDEHHDHKHEHGGHKKNGKHGEPHVGSPKKQGRVAKLSLPILNNPR